MKLSLYVVETKHNNTPVFYNTVTKQYLPTSSSKDDLQNNFFLKGSEQAAIWKHLTRPTHKAAFTIINTWECNLRCTHCTVINKLVKHDSVNFNTKATIDFLNRFQDYYRIETILLTFLGGEPLLNPQSILDCMDEAQDRKYKYGITTNLTTTFDELTWKVLKRLHLIGISIDGTKEAHNTQRKSLSLTNDPFLTTINNLKLLVKAGLTNIISVQGALSDNHLTEEHRNNYYRMLLKLGIPFSKIKFACIHPTEKQPNATESFKTFLKNTKPIAQPCCKYRYHSHVIDRDGSIFSDYYTWEKIGTIYDDIKDLDKISKDVITRMPALSDPICKQCPALGNCWGGCTNGHTFSKNPSNYCNQSGIINAIKTAAENNTLIGEQ